MRSGRAPHDGAGAEVGLGMTGVRGKSRGFGALALLLLLAACSGARTSGEASLPQTRGVYKVGEPYAVNGRWYRPQYDPAYEAVGIASWYGAAFHGRRTANGEIFDRNRLTAAHPTLPLPSLVEVTNLENGRRLVVRVNDRGPFVDGRLIDLSEAAARRLGFRRKGLARVRVRFLRLAEDARGRPPRPGPVRAERSAPAEGDAAGRLRRCEDLATPYFVQLGAFRDTARAREAARRTRGLAPIRFESTMRGEVRLARVVLGPIASAAVARSILDRVRRMGYPEAFLSAGGRGAVPCLAGRFPSLG